MLSNTFFISLQRSPSWEGRHINEKVLLKLSSTFKLRNFDTGTKMMAIALHHLIYTYLKRSEYYQIGVGYCFIRAKVMRRPECRIKQIGSHTFFMPISKVKPLALGTDELILIFMNRVAQKEVMHKCFMYMMCNGFLKEERKWMTTLKSILFILKELNEISSDDTWNCALDFFRDYNLGCQPPMPLSYIENIMLPAIDECNVDVPMGMAVLASVGAVIIDKN